MAKSKKKAERRPTKHDRELYIDHLQNGMRRGAASRAIGLDRHIFDGYIAEHPEFEAAVIDAETDATEHVEEALWQAAASGNVAAAKLWLSLEPSRHARRRPQVDDAVVGDPRPDPDDDDAAIEAAFRRLDDP